MSPDALRMLKLIASQIPKLPERSDTYEGPPGLAPDQVKSIVDTFDARGVVGRDVLNELVQGGYVDRVDGHVDLSDLGIDTLRAEPH